DVLLDRPTVPFDPIADLPVVPLIAIANVLRVRAVRTLGGADDIDEQHGDELALLRHGAGDRGSAGRAESRVVRQLRPALRTAHASSSHASHEGTSRTSPGRRLPERRHHL